MPTPGFFIWYLEVGRLYQAQPERQHENEWQQTALQPSCPRGRLNARRLKQILPEALVIFYVLVPRLHQGSLQLECVEPGQISGNLFVVMVSGAIQHVGAVPEQAGYEAHRHNNPFAFLVKPL